ATNRNLEKLVEEGRFRKDLYYRLKVVTIHVPPLRERLEDVPELAHYFLFRFDRELGLDLRGFSPEALAWLESRSWPGNVRELQSVVKQAMLRSSGHILLPEFLPGIDSKEEAVSDPAPRHKAAFDLNEVIEELLRQQTTGMHATVIEEVERILFARVLRHTHGHQAQASELLGLNRTTLRHKLRSLGLAMDKVLVQDQMGNPPAEEAPRKSFP